MLQRLVDVGFEVGTGGVQPFDQPLPLVTAWAVERSTASLALIVEDPEDIRDPEPWRELLFALSGLRHELREGRPSAFGTPVAIAILRSATHGRALRGLIEEISTQYVLFSRLELNIVVPEDGASGVDRALAPLLVRCRKALRDGAVVGPEVLNQLADEIDSEVRSLVGDLDSRLAGDAANFIVDGFATALARLVRGDAAATPLEPQKPDGVRLTNFRSFVMQDIPLGTVTALEGLNGTGKSSIVEALEILWSGSSQRKPPDASAQEYDRHLARDGDQSWSVDVLDDGIPSAQPITRTLDRPSAALARDVLSQDGALDIARASEASRYSELLRMTGLAIPELLQECQRLNRRAKDDLDASLRKVGANPLQRVNARALEHVEAELSRVGHGGLPSSEAVRRSEDSMKRVATELGVDYLRLEFDDPAAELDELRLAVVTGIAKFHAIPGLEERVNNLARRIEEVEAGANQRASALERLSETLRSLTRLREQERPEVESSPAEPPALPLGLATRWLSLGRAMRIERDELVVGAESLTDPDWKSRLDAFNQALGDVVDGIPFDALKSEVSRGSRPIGGDRAVNPESRRRPEPQLQSTGLVPIAASPQLEGLDGEAAALASHLRQYARSLSQFRASLSESPAIKLEPSLEAELRNNLVAFEIAKRLRAPLERAQESLLERLLSGPLQPVLLELIDALTRFEWYFHPFRLRITKGAIRMTGGATASPELDVRMLLNSGERAVISNAWFLALHLLQPASERAVLVIDDPLSALDENNQAALIATLRVLTRLTRPSLVLLSTHDQTVADMVEREMARVDDWPVTMARLRCARDPDGHSVVEGESLPAPEASYESERAKLGTGGASDLARVGGRA